MLSTQYTGISRIQLEDNHENIVRCWTRRAGKGWSLFSLSLSLLPLTQTQAHTRGRPLAPAAIINQVFHFSGLKAFLSWTECDSDATNRGKTHRCNSHATIEFKSKLQEAQSLRVLRCVTAKQGTIVRVTVENHHSR